MIKQPKVYIRSLDVILPVEVINYHEQMVEVYLNDNADNVPFNFDEVEFIYGTGFIDKNGKEIESGDILKTEFEDVFSIKFNNVSGFCAIKEDIRYWLVEEDLEYELRETLSKTEVIGNIYKNKDLLED
mgnify:CR=1 FL=1